MKGRGNKIVVETIVKSKIGELEERVRADSLRRTSKEFTDVVQGVSGRTSFFVSFQDGRKKNLSSNQITVVIVEKIPEEKEPEVSEIAEIPEEQVESEKGYYCCVYVILQFKNGVGVAIKEDQADVEDDTNEEDMDDINLEDERRRHWRMAFEGNDGGVDDAKSLIHAKRWDVYVNEKEKLVKGGYLVEVVSHDGQKVIWEVVGNNVVEDQTDHNDIGLLEFDLNLFDKDEEGESRCSEKLHLWSYLETVWFKTGYFGLLGNNHILFIILLYLIER